MSDDLILTVGRITGMALRFTPAEFDELAASPDLTATNRAMVQLLANYRRELGKLMYGETDAD